MQVHYSEISNTPITKLAELALKKPDDFGYWGSKDMFVTWGFTGHDETGMARVLERANFKTISESLLEEFPNDFRIENYSHWACGHVDRLVCRILKEPGGIIEDNITEAFKAAIDWHISLENYPVADENVYSEMEVAEIFYWLNDLPFREMFDENPSWREKLLESLYVNFDAYISPDGDAYPKDEDIYMAAYLANLCNSERLDLWEDFCSENGLELPSKKPNPNQLNLFED